MNAARQQRMVCWAARLAIVALLLMLAAVLVPLPLSVVLAMTVGQVLGTASLALYVAAIAADLWTRRGP